MGERDIFTRNATRRILYALALFALCLKGARRDRVVCPCVVAELYVISDTARFLRCALGKGLSHIIGDDVGRRVHVRRWCGLLRR